MAPFDEKRTVSRRAFLGFGAAAGGVLPVVGAEGCTPDDGDPPVRSGTDPSVGPTRTNPVSAFELDEVSITDLHSGMVSGRWTAQEITQLYLDRIAYASEEKTQHRRKPEFIPTLDL